LAFLLIGATWPLSMPLWILVQWLDHCERNASKED
jgi:hypothetical protein